MPGGGDPARVPGGEGSGGRGWITAVVVLLLLAVAGGVVAFLVVRWRRARQQEGDSDVLAHTDVVIDHSAQSLHIRYFLELIHQSRFHDKFV